MVIENRLRFSEWFAQTQTAELHRLCMYFSIDIRTCHIHTEVRPALLLHAVQNVAIQKSKSKPNTT